MKYMQTGGFQHQPFMRLTISCTLVFLFGLWLTNFAMYFSRMGLTPDTVKAHYLGSEAEFTPPKSFGSMLETAHAHLPMQGLVLLLLTHLLIFAPYSDRAKTLFIAGSFLAALADEGSGWLVRFIHPDFAALKIVSFLSLQGMMLFLLGGMAAFLRRAAAPPKRKH